MKYNIESLILRYYIKYDRLEEMCKTSLLYSNNIIDIYIDLYDLLKPLYVEDTIYNNKFSIVSLIINLAAHYRRYFSNRNIWTRIFLIYADQTTMSHKQYYQSFACDRYKMNLGFHKVNEFIKSQLKLLKILCGYLDDIYYIERQCNFAIASMYNINTFCNRSIIITKCKYSFQIPAYTHNAVIFKPKKYKGDDNSYSIITENVLVNFYNKIKNNKTINMLNRINPELLSVLIVLTGLPEYNLNTIHNITNASKIVIDAIDNHRIINAYNNDIERLYDQLNISLNKQIFINRFYAVDLIHQYRVYLTTSECKDISWYINLNDSKTLKDINNKYFIDNPLDLNSL